MELVYLIVGACLFAGGCYCGWRAAYARQDEPAPAVFDAPRGRSKVLDYYSEPDDEPDTASF